MSSEECIDGRDFLRIQEQFFAAAIVALGLSLRGVNAAMVFEIEFAVPERQIELRQLGFEVTLVRDADLRTMREAIEAFSQQLRQGGVGLLYFAGHGVQVSGENYMLPLSHDEVVYGKGSLWSRMPGDDWQKAANLRLLFGYMYAQPGKKLLFMGGEFGQPGEWNHDGNLDWDALLSPLHQGVQRWLQGKLGAGVVGPLVISGIALAGIGVLVAAHRARVMQPARA